MASSIKDILKRKFRNENLVSLGAIAVIIFISTSSQYEIFYPWFSYYGLTEILKYLLPYNIMLFLLYANYFITMFINPGYVPDEFNKSIFEAKKLAKKEKKKDKNSKNKMSDDDVPLNQLRNRKFLGVQLKGYLPLKCDKCNGYKPARAHHCSICNRCVLRMDHHCPWVANCVGYNNVAYFGRFLGYVTILCLYNLILIGKRILNVIDYQNNKYNYDIDETQKPYPLIAKKEMIFIVIDLIMLFVVVFLVAPLFAFQVMYATSNTSTIEDRENKKIDILKEKGEVPDVKYPYDYGWFENLKDVYGSNIFNWFFNGKGSGDGVNFKIVGNYIPSENNEYLVYWPPKEYYQYKRVKKEDIEAQESKKKYGTRNYDGKLSRHVRRDSEGYVVRTTTEEDRERMVMKAFKREAERERRNQQKLLLQQQKEQQNNLIPENSLENEATNTSQMRNRKVISITQVMEDDEYNTENEEETESESSGTESGTINSDYDYSEYDSDYDENKFIYEDIYVPKKVREVDSSDLWSDEIEEMNEYIEEIPVEDEQNLKDKNV